MIEHLLTLDTILSQKFTLSSKSGSWRLARFMAHLGDGPYVFGILGIIYLFSWFQGDRFLRNSALIITIIIFVTMIVITSIKYLVQRQRPIPPGEFVTFQYDAYSFPSGHSARMAALSISSLFFYPNLGWMLLGLTLTIALARVAVGVHYVSDIIVGLSIGGFIAWLSLVTFSAYPQMLQFML